MLVFVDLKERKVSSGVRAPERFEIDEFHWASPTRIIYLIAERQPGMVRPTPTGEIFGVDRDGKKHRMLYGYRAGEDMGGTRLGKRNGSIWTAIKMIPAFELALRQRSGHSSNS